MPIVNGNLLPATGRLPATGLANWPFTQPVQFPTSPLRLPFSTEQPVPPVFVPPRYSLPEQPLKTSPAFGAENLALALAVLPVIRTIRETFGIVDALRRYTILYGKVKVDVPFYAVFFTSGTLTQKASELENQLLSIPNPRTTVGTGSFISNLVRPEPTELDLQNSFDRALFGTSAQVANAYAAILRRRRDALPWLLEDVGTTRQEKIDKAFEEGLSFRPLIEAQSDIASARSLSLLQFVRQMQLFGVFSGRGAGGAFPGEQGDP